MTTLFYASYAFGTVFLICELCERVGNLFIENDIKTGNLNWYSYPREFHGMFPTILIMTQQPFEIGCFGSITCSRVTFRKVNSKQIFKILCLIYSISFFFVRLGDQQSVFLFQCDESIREVNLQICTPSSFTGLHKISH